jgi:osmotically-inducible protein OsmY
MKHHKATVSLLAAIGAVLLLTVACGGSQSVGQAVDDATITANVKSALISAPNVDALAINVDTQNGIVTLTGKVKTQEEGNRARDVARGVEGVRDVKASLEVQPAG